MNGLLQRNAVHAALLLATLLVASAAPASAGWGWIGGGWAPGESVTGAHADTGFGYNVGVGFDIQIDSGAALYVDARWHHAYMPGVDMDVIPISFGVRW